MAEWLKAINCKFIEYSTRVQILLSLFRNITQLVAYQFWEPEVIGSNPIISNFLNIKLNFYKQTIYFVNNQMNLYF